jgi:SAM-dependent methyltransferase
VQNIFLQTRGPNIVLAMQRNKGNRPAMFDDITAFRAFYQSPLGRRVASAVKQHSQPFWQGMARLNCGFCGYGPPFVDNDPRLVGLMPARRGAVVWPTGSPGRTCLVDTNGLPFPDVFFDRLLLVHALEFEADPGRMLDECWRCLDGSGRLLVVVPNRRGLWARAERTPFGHGQPYSRRQLHRLLESHGFIPRFTARAVFIPPFANRLVLRFAPTLERVGAVWWPAMGGVILVEAEKMLYAPSGTRRAQPQRMRARPVLAGQTSGHIAPNG